MDNKDEKKDLSSFKERVAHERQKFWELEEKSPANEKEDKKEPNSANRSNKLGNILLFLGTFLATVIVTAVVLITVIK